MAPSTKITFGGKQLGSTFSPQTKYETGYAPQYQTKYETGYAPQHQNYQSYQEPVQIPNPQVQPQIQPVRQ